MTVCKMGEEAGESRVIEQMKEKRKEEGRINKKET